MHCNSSCLAVACPCVAKDYQSWTWYTMKSNSFVLTCSIFYHFHRPWLLLVASKSIENERHFDFLFFGWGGGGGGWRGLSSQMMRMKFNVLKQLKLNVLVLLYIEICVEGRQVLFYWLHLIQKEKKQPWMLVVWSVQGRNVYFIAQGKKWMDTRTELVLACILLFFFVVVRSIVRVFLMINCDCVE